MSPKMKFTTQDSDGSMSERVSDQLTTSLLLETKILPTDIQANHYSTLSQFNCHSKNMYLKSVLIFSSYLCLSLPWGFPTKLLLTNIFSKRCDMTVATWFERIHKKCARRTKNIELFLKLTLVTEMIS